MTRRTFAFSLAATAAAPGVRAQEPLNKAQARGRELIHQAVNALGGQAFRTMQNRLEVGRAASFHADRLSGLSIARLYTHYLEPPNPRPPDWFGVEERQVLGKKGEDVILFNQRGGFEVTYRGVRPLSDQIVSRHKEAAITSVFYILRQRLDEPGILFEAKGVDVVENQQVELVDIIDSQDRQVTVYLNHTTFLPAMQKYYRFDTTYKERIEEVSRFSTYKRLSTGVQWPLDVQRDREGEKLYQMFADTVTVGNQLDEKIFQLPSDAPMLKKQDMPF